MSILIERSSAGSAGVPRRALEIPPAGMRCGGEDPGSKRSSTALARSTHSRPYVVNDAFSGKGD